VLTAYKKKKIIKSMLNERRQANHVMTWHYQYRRLLKSVTTSNQGSDLK
jgi:hypothetical protein